MKKHYRYCALIAASLIMLAGAVSGCIGVSQEVPDELAPPPTPLDDTDDADGLSASYPPVIDSFIASPETVSPGGSATLSWHVSGATTVAIHPVIESTSSGGVERGVEQVSPTITTIYTLTAANEAGSSTKSVTVTVGTSEDTLIGRDPVSGRNQEIDFTWEQFCLASQYQVQIAKNPGFTLIVFDSGAFAPASATSPAVYYPAGGAIASPAQAGSAIASGPTLEAGHTYYWRVRVRQAATGQMILSPWSEVKSFTIESGLPASTPYYGAQLLQPSNGGIGCPVSPVSFSWSPSKGTTRYKFMLANDPGFRDMVADAEVPTTAYQHEGTLAYSTSYFWRVMALEPAPGDWSAVYSFQTVAAPAPEPAPAPPAATPLWAWVTIAVGGVLVIAILVLTFMVRRV